MKNSVEKRKKYEESENYRVFYISKLLFYQKMKEITFLIETLDPREKNTKKS